MSVEGEVWMGVRFPANQKSKLTIPGAFGYDHIRTGLDDLGFFVCLKKRPKIIDENNKLTIEIVSAGQALRKELKVHSTDMQPVFIPSILDLDDPFATVDISFEADNPGLDIFLATSRRVARDSLYRLAKGTGVEIGPGPKPQILNTVDTQVTYIEEKMAEEWLSLYNDAETEIAWSADNYKIGKAHDLPVADESLDFIFSSHVLEHLYNPIGHFKHWHAKLKPGGLILGVVPSAEGTKDILLPRTKLPDLVAENETNSFAIPLEAYHHWVTHHQPHHSDTEQVAKEYLEKKFSIHVHVYDYVSVNDLLLHCTENEGFSDYRIFYKRNAKDFIFAMRK